MADGKPFLSVYGHVTIDQIVSIERFPEMNESVDVISKNTTLGGTGTNIATAAATLGVRTAICAFGGDDFPANYESRMRDSGLIMDEMIKVGEYETSQALVINDLEMRQKVIFYQGPQGSASKLNNLLTKNASSSRYVHFCTGDPAYYISVMENISGSNAMVSLDPAQEIYKMWNTEKIKNALEFSDALFCNNYEAKVIERHLGIKSVLDIEKDLVVCTEGEDGSVAKIGGEIIRIPVIKGKAVKDATGAGDAYRAGFYCGRYKGYDVRESLVLASATSSLVVEEVGALTNLPTWDSVLERADRYL